MDNTVNSSGTFTEDSGANNKFEISHLNLHYGAFHALKDIISLAYLCTPRTCPYKNLPSIIYFIPNLDSCFATVSLFFNYLLPLGLYVGTNSLTSTLTAAASSLYAVSLSISNLFSKSFFSNSIGLPI